MTEIQQSEVIGRKHINISNIVYTDIALSLLCEMSSVLYACKKSSLHCLPFLAVQTAQCVDSSIGALSLTDLVWYIFGKPWAHEHQES